MKTLILLAGLASAVSIHAADFVNLKFDEPDLSGPLTPTFPNGPLKGSAAQILRGWTVLANGVPLQTSGYSPAGTFGVYSPVGLFDNAFDFRKEDFGPYGVALQSGFGVGSVLQLRQTGTIPADAATLGIFGSGGVNVLINGQLIGSLNTQVTAYPVFNVSPWAGQAVELTFDFGPATQMSFDVFGFKPVPEPQTWALLGVGLAVLGWHCWRRKS